MIAVIGATSVIGSALVERLIEQGKPVRALSRDAERLRSRFQQVDSTLLATTEADAGDPDSLRSAFAGTDQVFLAMANSPQQLELETAVIRAAAEAGAGHIVKVSSPAFSEVSPVTIAGWHGQIERQLAETGISHTVLRPYAFMQNLLRLTPTIATQNMFFGAMGQAPCNFIDSRDIADAAAAVIGRPELRGKIYTLTGAETFSYDQIAAKLTTLLGRDIRYVPLAPEALLRQLVEVGRMPLWLAHHVVEIQVMATLIAETPTDDVKTLTGKEPRTLEAFLHEHRAGFQLM